VNELSSRSTSSGLSERGQLLGDELPYIFRAQFAKNHRPVGEPRQQQPLDDAQTAAARAGGQTARITHVGIVAAQLIRDGTRRRSRLRNDVPLAQDRQQ